MTSTDALSRYAFTPYCGAPPYPGALLARWNLDPWLLAILAIIALAYVWNVKCAPWRRVCFYAGWTIGALALISPLCALSVSLFSARVGQHMLLTCIVAPLIALGSPPLKLGRGAGSVEWLTTGLFAGMLWFWHAPGPYTMTFESTAAYWAMHLTLFGSAFLLWAALLEAADRRIAPFLAAMIITSLQMGLLGAVITFAARPLYPVHALTTVTWGLTSLEDQQLGGVIMWVPAGLIFVGAVMLSLAWSLRRAEQGAAAGVLS